MEVRERFVWKADAYNYLARPEVLVKLWKIEIRSKLLNTEHQSYGRDSSSLNFCKIWKGLWIPIALIRKERIVPSTSTLISGISSPPSAIFPGNFCSSQICNTLSNQCQTNEQSCRTRWTHFWKQVELSWMRTRQNKREKFVKENYGIDSIVKSMMHFLSQLT